MSNKRIAPFSKYLEPTFFLDYNTPELLQFVEKIVAPSDTKTQKAIKLFYAVRDGWKYNPYLIDLNKDQLKASSIFKKKDAYCVEKALLLCALYRSIGIPSGLCFSIVRNHIATEKWTKFWELDTFIHCATEVYLNNHWYKATVSFDKDLCLRYNFPPLEFNGTADTLFQAYNNDGKQFMEYVTELGSFDDHPYDYYLSFAEKEYPNLFKILQANNMVFDLLQYQKKGSMTK
ncbi:MAG: transglutaminase-like domain-containing protein [Phycisphaerales bacterium]|nr:transglutaminase-like domain-containing protein [Phycisphaerales bacterium]